MEKSNFEIRLKGNLENLDLSQSILENIYWKGDKDIVQFKDVKDFEFFIIYDRLCMKLNADKAIEFNGKENRLRFVFDSINVQRIKVNAVFNIEC